ncbi:MAG TPA: PspC domain-containing protein [Baekduia sp.]|uniref:PspC domain-containing protein n=1 Tax=Baekduia sp. TaxID=2600305 RepID=UPI002D790A40|nr:PspC domain-containing protein [Baekduia sp.]HET6505522.1 PspC domain-containing protein [Baekduia sp.]
MSEDQTTTSSPARPEPPRRLLRSRDERVVGGVCGGLAKYFNVDPLIFRIAAVALVFVGGFAIVAYIAALLLVPQDDGTGQPVPGKPGRFSTIVGAVTIVVAGILLINGDWGIGSGWVFGALVPTAILVVILAVAGQRLLATRGESRPAAGRIVGAALILLAILVGTVILAASSAIATAAGGGTVVAIVVLALGVALVGLSFQDRRARWLVVPALAIAIPSGVVQAAGVKADNGIGQRSYLPATIADLKPSYELGVGQLVVDLRQMDWPKGETAHVKAKVGMGHLLVLVPRDACVQADTHNGLGYVGVLGEEGGGADVDDQHGTIARAPGRKLVLDADMGIGAVEVLHVRHDSGNWDHGHHGDTITDGLAAAGCAGERA